MNLAGLDFRNPVGHNAFGCFKKICVIEINMNENLRENPEFNHNQQQENYQIYSSDPNQR